MYECQNVALASISKRIHTGLDLAWNKFFGTDSTEEIFRIKNGVFGTTSSGDFVSEIQIGIIDPVEWPPASEHA